MVASENRHENEVHRSGVRQLLPAWLVGYDRAWLRSDFLAGLAVWALVVPQAIAYAGIAGLPPEAGLYTTFAGLIGYALLGTSRQIVVSPTSSTALISAALVAPLALSESGAYAELSATLAIMLGVTFALLGIWKMGFVSQFIATPVQVGVMFGLGMTIIAGQMGKLTGVEISEGTFVEQSVDLVRHLSETNGWTVAVGMVSLIVLLTLQRRVPGIPAALIVVAAAIALSHALSLADHGVAVVGDVPRSVPLPSVPTPSWNQIVSLLPGVLVIAVIGYAETDTVAEQFANDHRYSIKPNRELMALGAANGMSGLFQGFITAGGASQSAANDRAGARTQLASLVVAGLTLVTIVALLPLFRQLPEAVLGAIVISAVIGFLRVREMDRIRRFRSTGLALALVALLGVLVLGIMPGLLIAITLSLLHLLNGLSRPGASLLGRLPGTPAFVDLSTHPRVESEAGLLIFRLNAPLIFINATTMREHLETAIRQANPPPRVVLVVLAFSNDLDLKSFDTLTSLHRELSDDGIQLWLAEVHGPVLDMLQRGGASELFGAGNVFHTVGEAVDRYRRDIVSV